MSTFADLLPTERIALTVAVAAVMRGDEPGPNTAAACILALGRITGHVTVDDDGYYHLATQA